MIYVELWFDVEKDRQWKITLWQLKDKDFDFDPFETQYITLDIGTDNQHTAREIQLSIVRDLKLRTDVVANAYIDRSRYIIRPRWMEELLSPLGRTEQIKTQVKAVELEQLQEAYLFFLQAAAEVKN